MVHGRPTLILSAAGTTLTSDNTEHVTKSTECKSRQKISVCVLPTSSPFSFVWFNMLCLVLLALLPTAFAIDCVAEGNGVHEKGCRAFVTCNAGVATITECQGNMVFDDITKKCADPSRLSNLCSQIKNCSVLSDGKYHDPICSTYFTCYGGTFFGHNYCPGGTVFNEALQSCDWPNDTLPPCGTKGLSTPARG
ncbi:chitin-binding domain protein cbd-1-like isoform X1 [Haliotis rubra]|uniref:chitin-binding domain protein cbd-1-like isoform X1 n=1 Tax=Haliotis rubra TaxID=36100 RepID=UPI001EE53FD4|nr:chitin-binding domain protein cbd-1-like isoform X1 [Haliotis rubra]